MNAKVPDEYMIPIENLMNPRALDFHAGSEFIYFADATSYIIGRQKIDGTERDTIVKEGGVLTTDHRDQKNKAYDLGQCDTFPVVTRRYVVLRNPYSGGHRCGLDGRQLVLDR